MSIPASRSSPLPVFLICLGVAAMALDIGVSRITYGVLLVPLRNDLQLTYTQAGLLSSANLAAYLAGTLLAPSLGRRFSMPWLACGGHAVVALGALLNGIAPDIWTLAAGRVLLGGGAGVALVALFVVTFNQTPPARRGTVSAIIWSGIGVALVATGLSLPLTLDTPGAWRYAFLVSAVIGAIVTIGLWPKRAIPGSAARNVPAPPAAPARPRHYRGWLPLFLAYALFGLSYIAYTTFVSVRLANLHLPTAAITTSWVVMGLAVLAGCWLTAKLLSRPAVKPLALILSLVSAAAGSLLVAGGSPAAATAAAVFVGLGLASSPAILTAYVRERTDDADYPRLFSIATAFLGIGQLAGPAIAGLLTDHFGPLAVVYFAFLAYAVGAAMAAIDMALVRKRGR